MPYTKVEVCTNRLPRTRNIRRRNNQCLIRHYMRFIVMCISVMFASTWYTVGLSLLNVNFRCMCIN